MASPIGGRLSDAFKETYLDAGLTQHDVVVGLHKRGFPNIDQPLVSKWSRGMRAIPLDVVPALDEICGVTRGTILRRAGYVADSKAVSVEEAVKADPTLTARYRREVLSFVSYARAQSAQPVS